MGWQVLCFSTVNMHGTRACGQGEQKTRALSPASWRKEKPSGTEGMDFQDTRPARSRLDSFSQNQFIMAGLTAYILALGKQKQVDL